MSGNQVYVTSFSTNFLVKMSVLTFFYEIVSMGISYVFNKVENIGNKN